MAIDHSRGLPDPLPDDILAQIRRDARSGNDRFREFVIEQLGMPPEPFDPETNHDDRVILHRAASTAQRDEYAEEIRAAKHLIANHLPRPLSGCLTFFLLFTEFIVGRGVFLSIGADTLTANALAVLVVLMTAFIFDILCGTGGQP